MPAPIVYLKAAARRAVARTGYVLVKYKTERGGFGLGASSEHVSGGGAPASAPDMEPEFRELHAKCAAFTMTPPARMYNLYLAMRHIIERRIEGDIVECGVWRGGSAMLCALMLARAGDTQRRVWLYDTFAGMAEPTDKDRSAEGMNTHDIWAASQRGGGGGDEGHNQWCYAPLDDVKANMAATGLPTERFEYVIGKVEDTLPTSRPERIALLRLDTDWYESTKSELAHLYPLLSPGGVLLVDDYGQWLGQREAVDEYFATAAQRPLLARIDQSSRMGIKPIDARPRGSGA